ncbi:transposase [Akanthomyces lecanii RCEF 1005]|uniref:Transposase n=1 Tax=Akanthomyces lecanii RCEF 1005 TaxID=1081108 RepID=A0A167R831_CORDF|nr:transposase [Akanthomyces lecanii RCEF 1005]
MTNDQVDDLVAYIMKSKATRQMTYLELSIQLFNGQFSQWVIKRVLHRQGFRRRVARRKPPISEANRLKRKAFAEAHKGWSIDQWADILWTDETWVSGGTYRQVLVTRRAGEEYDLTCVVERYQRKRGWMFWGSFAGHEKGPGIFWEKDWGSINAQSYADHTVPIIDGWLQLQQGLGKKLVLM